MKAAKSTFIRTINILVVLLLGICGCGGGTSGSGLKTYEGRVLNVNGNPIPGVNVLIESTGDESSTNDLGEFAIKSEASGETVPFLLTTETFQQRFSLSDVPDESSRISLEITVDQLHKSVHVTNLQVRALFAGLCDYYFENREIIRQANTVPPGTICSLNVEVSGDGRRLPDVPIALQYARCEYNSPWNTLVTGKTGTGSHRGFAEINFEFVDSSEFCRYRVVAPFGVEGVRESYYPIDTFSEQEYFKK